MQKEENEVEKNAWRRVKYSEKFRNAFRGLYVFAKATRHLFIHVLVGLIVVVAGFYFKVSSAEFIATAFSLACLCYWFCICD